MFIVERECAFMRALRAQTCAQHYPFSHARAACYRELSVWDSLLHAKRAARAAHSRFVLTACSIHALSDIPQLLSCFFAARSTTEECEETAEFWLHHHWGDAVRNRRITSHDRDTENGPREYAEMHRWITPYVQRSAVIPLPDARCSRKCV
jgi:hypothetical protein